MYILELRHKDKRKMSVKYLYNKGFRNFKEVNAGKHTFHFEIKVEDKSLLKKYIKKASRYKYNFIYYDTKYCRSSHYRKKFLEYNKPPYRCRYCNKKLTKDTVIVDHLIPVDAVKKVIGARLLLHNSGCESVNDIHNLVPSCSKCNSRKSNLMGLWYIRGKLGKYKLYWISIYTTSVLLLLSCIYGVYHFLTDDFSLLMANLAGF